MLNIRLRDCPDFGSYPMQMFGIEVDPRFARCRVNGRKRAAFWRLQGFPNLVLARAARWKGHVKKTDAAKLETPFKLDGRPRGF